MCLKPSQDPTEGMGPCEFLWEEGQQAARPVQRSLGNLVLAGGVEGMLRPQGVGGVGKMSTQRWRVGTRLCPRWTKL